MRNDNILVKTNKLAVTSFVFGVGQFLLIFCLPVAIIPAAVLAIVFGHMSLHQVKKTQETGALLANIGRIIGYVSLSILMIGCAIGFMFHVMIPV